MQVRTKLPRKFSGPTVLPDEKSGPRQPVFRLRKWLLKFPKNSAKPLFLKALPDISNVSSTPEPSVWDRRAEGCARSL